MTSNEKSIEIPIKEISVRFLQCGKFRGGPPRNDVSEHISPSGIFEADAIEQYGQRKIVSTSGLVEECGEDVYQMVVDAAQEDAAIANKDISVCHRNPGA